MIPLDDVVIVARSGPRIKNALGHCPRPSPPANLFSHAAPIGAMNRIAILGLGSLCWEGQPRFDRQHGFWSERGPLLKVEFSRVSSTRRGALTLVIDPVHGAPTRVAFALSHRSNLNTAIA